MTEGDASVEEVAASLEEVAASLEEVAARRRMPKRDCRSCAHFEPGEDGLGFGWCGVHDQFVKLYHPAGQFWSQCQFTYLRQERQERQGRQGPD
jgi:hypothetical protein